MAFIFSRPRKQGYLTSAQLFYLVYLHKINLLLFWMKFFLMYKKTSQPGITLFFEVFPIVGVLSLLKYCMLLRRLFLWKILKNANLIIYLFVKNCLSVLSRLQMQIFPRFLFRFLVFTANWQTIARHLGYLIKLFLLLKNGVWKQSFIIKGSQSFVTLCCIYLQYVKNVCHIFYHL